MDTDIKTTQDELDKVFENIPEEVEDFMWSDAYTIILDAIQTTLSLTDEQKNRVRLASYDILTNQKSMVDVAQELSKDMAPELVAKILYAIDSEILTRAENLTEFYSEDPDETATEVGSTTSTNSTSDILSRLNQSFTAPATLAPIKRDVSTPSGGTESSPLPASSEKRIDPYREIPEV